MASLLIQFFQVVILSICIGLFLGTTMRIMVFLILKKYRQVGYLALACAKIIVLALFSAWIIYADLHTSGNHYGPNALLGLYGAYLILLLGMFPGVYAAFLLIEK